MSMSKLTSEFFDKSQMPGFFDVPSGCIRSGLILKGDNIGESPKSTLNITLSYTTVNLNFKMRTICSRDKNDMGAKTILLDNRKPIWQVLLSNQRKRQGKNHTFVLFRHLLLHFMMCGRKQYWVQFLQFNLRS